MLFGAAIPCLNEWRFMPAVVGQVLKHVDRCVVIRNRTSFSGASVDVFPAPNFAFGLNPKVEVIDGEWPTEHATRNAAMDMLSDCDYVFHLDSDEVLLDGDFESLKKRCDGYAAIGTRMHTYWKTPEWRIDPPEFLAPIVLVKKDVRFSNLRNVDKSVAVLAKDVWLHHLSYVRTDEEVREKLRIFAHAREVRPYWFEMVWRRWDADHSIRNLHPIVPAHYQRAICAPCADLDKILATPALMCGV